MCIFIHIGQPSLAPPRRLQWGPSAVARMSQGAEGHDLNRLVAECYGQDSLGKLPFGKLPIGKNPLGKYITSIQNPLVFYLSYNEEDTTCCFLHEMSDLGFFPIGYRNKFKIYKIKPFLLKNKRKVSSSVQKKQKSLNICQLMHIYIFSKL